MICRRCGRPIRADRGVCPTCRAAIRERGTRPERETGVDFLDALIDPAHADGPWGPLQDFELRSDPSSRPVTSGRARGRRTSVTRGTPRGRPSRKRRAPLPRRRGPDATTLTLEPQDGTGHAWPAGAEGSIARRITAAGLDLVLLLGVSLGVVYLTLRVLDLSPREVSRLPLVPMATFLGAFSLGYLVLMTAYGGQTIGKMAARLRVEGLRGEPLTVAHALRRVLACGLCMAPAGAGFIGVLARSRRAWQDRLSRTRVVRVGS